MKWIFVIIIWVVFLVFWIPMGCVLPLWTVKQLNMGIPMAYPVVAFLFYVISLLILLLFRKTRSKKLLISLPPILVFTIITYLYCRQFKEPTFFAIHGYYKYESMFNASEGIANRFGLIIYKDLGYYRILDYKKPIIYVKEGGGGLFSLDERRWLVQPGESLLTIGEVFSNGLYCGIKTKQSDVIISPIYSSIEKTNDYFIVTNKEGGKGIINGFGFLVIPCDYVSITEKIGVDDGKEFLICGNERIGNTNAFCDNDLYKKSVVITADELRSPSTRIGMGEVEEIINQNCFVKKILHSYFMINSDGETIVRQPKSGWCYDGYYYDSVSKEIQFHYTETYYDDVYDSYYEEYRKVERTKRHYDVYDLSGNLLKRIN